MRSLCLSVLVSFMEILDVISKGPFLRAETITVVSSGTAWLSDTAATRQRSGKRSIEMLYGQETRLCLSHRDRQRWSLLLDNFNIDRVMS